MRAKTFVVEDPATLQPIAELADGGAEEARLAVDRASAAFPEWSTCPPRDRSDILRRAFDLVSARQGDLAEMVCRENGKSRADADAEVSYAAEFLRWYSEEAVRPGGGYAEAPSGGARSIVRHRPVGVAALVTPWNFPAAMVTRKVAPALAAGCTAVLKPASETPLTALAIVDALRESGLPEGCLELLTTTDHEAVVGGWLADPRVRKLSFTGSTAVGRQLLRQAADRVLNCSMELGGNAQFIVLDDADLDGAVAAAMTAKFRNGGQACTAANRLYVHERVADDFTGRLGAEVSSLRVGLSSQGCDIGPLISARAVDALEAKVDAAVRAGARVTHQAPAPELPGHFVAPRVVCDVRRDAALVCDEVFGPVAPVVTWRDERELLGWVNGSEVGLAAYVFAGDVGRALRFAEGIEAGMVGINRGVVSDPSAPFGGVKQSGLGREGGREGLRAFQEVQYVSLDWPATAVAS